MSRLSLLGIVALVLLWASPVLAQDIEREEREISRSLACPLGMNMSWDICEIAEVQAGRQAIRERLAQGQTREQIVSYLVGVYGEQILLAPTKKGFNLTAWLAPFAALLGGAALVAFLLRSWAGKGRKAPVKASPVPPQEEEKYRQKLEQELKDFGEGLR